MGKIYDALVQMIDVLCRIACALEQIAQSDMTLIDFDDIDWGTEDGG